MKGILMIWGGGKIDGIGRWVNEAELWCGDASCRAMYGVEASGRR
jgi:hypothetical protein